MGELRILRGQIKLEHSKNIGVIVPEVLLPAKGINLEKWAVVACDQYTSQEEYWHEVENFIGNEPSTLNMIFPEVYLECDDTDERIEKINQFMKKYLDENVLVSQQSCFVYIERKVLNGHYRKGLMVAVDLEEYDYNKGAKTLIRATEGTVLDRLPPRIKIRENAPLEIPHIMLLIDDPDKTVIEPLTNKTNELQKVYDFDLMMKGNNIKGYKVDSEELISNIFCALHNLANAEAMQSKYQVDDDKGILLFAAGDGNHSLATAKACWEEVKKELSEEEFGSHPARFALVEVVNVHDDALTFEPIHRVVFNVKPDYLLNKMMEYLKEKDINATYHTYDSKEVMDAASKDICTENGHMIPFVTSEHFGIIRVENPAHQLAVGTLQAFLNELEKTDNDIKIDYIHGDDVVEKLGCKEGNMGFYLPCMDKHDLFKTVIIDGALPRKTFSMGEAEEKRFYLECKKIV